MKYGLVVYLKTDNIGDDILSYAASRFLPSIDYIIDRENLDLFSPEKKEPVSAIMNGWFLHEKSHWPPSPYINPLFIGIHFTDNKFHGIKDAYLDGLGKDYLVEHAPIGCRDFSTLEKMQQRDINAYFSGCLTLTLEPYPDVEKHGKYILTDVPEQVQKRVCEAVGEDQVELVSHNADEKYGNQNWEQRSRGVECLLKKYQGAKCVITTRLHCALPCLALGVPVLLLLDDNEDTRYRIASYKDYVTHCSVSEFLQREFDWQNPFSNTEKYKDLQQSLIKCCRDFIEKSGSYESDIPLPDLNLFYTFWKEKALWQRSLLADDFMGISKHAWQEQLDSQKWYVEQIEAKDKRIHELEAWVPQLEAQISELKTWIGDLEKGKKWLEEHSAEQERYIQSLLNR